LAADVDIHLKLAADESAGSAGSPASACSAYSASILDSVSDMVALGPSIGLCSHEIVAATAAAIAATEAIRMKDICFS
jgi:hypothetical protein